MLYSCTALPLKLDVFLPDLLVPREWLAGYPAPALPALDWLLAQGEVTTTGAWPRPLLDAFGAPADVSLAALSADGEGLEPGDHGWLFAQPVHHRVDLDSVALYPLTGQEISLSESAALVVELNRNFAGQGLLFDAPAAERWYVRVDRDQMPVTVPLRDARRGRLFDHLPQSRGSLSWQAVQNEVQMLLHSHPVNAHREGIGQSAVNGVWFWGEGDAPTRRQHGYQAVFGRDPLLAGLAGRQAGEPVLQPAMAFTDIAPDVARAAWGIDALQVAFIRNDVEAWTAALLQLERDVFMPLRAALQGGRVRTLSLALPRQADSLTVVLDAGRLEGAGGWWRRWRRPPRNWTSLQQAADA